MSYILNGTRELVELAVPDFYLENESCSFPTNLWGRRWWGEGQYVRLYKSITIDGGFPCTGKLCSTSICVGLAWILFSIALVFTLLAHRKLLMLSKRRQKLLRKENRKLRSNSNKILGRLHLYRSQIKSYKRTHKDFEDLVRVIRNNHNMVIEENFNLRNERSELLSIRGLIDSDESSVDLEM